MGRFYNNLHIVVKYIEFCVAPIIPLVFSSAFYPIKSKKMIISPFLCTVDSVLYLQMVLRVLNTKEQS